ncbi:translocation/assembly module TamB domain-containing protein [Psychrobacter aestuarii]|uniref:Translocation and assembly module TamB C-terminal domain-containing protein n=1 Tax=Psychrobacter aestuarii TaxID=556327 RepID=A0ABP3FQU0_9GAMM|nr:translocation/assembly module TamB domain-containing protein [Psychrobacter aestuarii]
MSSQNSPPPEPIQEDPAQSDARVMRRWYPLSFLLKLLILMIVVLALMFAIFFYMAGTESGTAFILNKVAIETGAKFKYGEGNLRDGVMLTDIDIQATKDIEVIIDKAYVKIGWRAVFAKEVHLREADIGRIEIINTKPPTGEPFDYKTLKLPVNLRLDDAKVNTVVYKQVTKKPFILKDIAGRDLTWVGTEVTVGTGRLEYADIVKVRSLQGTIDFQGDYPLDASAIAEVSALEKVYIDPLNITATGSLKRTVGTLESRYNDSDVTGNFVVQGLDENAPFDAKLSWDKVRLPYLEDQDIELSDGVATASGVVSDIRLRINSELSAKDIPSGRYKGRARIADSRLNIERLDARTPAGNLALTGAVDWNNEVDVNVDISSRKFDLRTVLPNEYRDYQAYVPQTLNGTLGIRYLGKNANGRMQINADLDQRDGERINAKIIRGSNPAKSSQNAPLYIDATWRNLVRRNVPNVGNINSPVGSAKVTVQGSRVSADVTATINELNAAPQGDYDVRLQKVGERIDINRLRYDGVVGDLTGTGQIQLATKRRPLTWQIDAQTKGLRPKQYRSDLPVEQLVGSIRASGRMLGIQKNGTQGQRHIFTINSADLRASLDDTQDSRQIGIVGRGDGSVDVVGGQLSVFDVRFDGDVDTQDVPKGRFTIDAAGTPERISFRKLAYAGEAGALDAKGALDLRDDIRWDVSGRFNEFNVGYFLPNTPAIISGALDTSGTWQMAAKGAPASSGVLKQFAVDFDGALDTDSLPSGKLVLKARGNDQQIAIERLQHTGAAGSIDASGTVNMQQGISWDIRAQMQRFNLGYFVTDLPSNITGSLQSNGRWGEGEQVINLEQIDLQGTLKGQAISASGSLETTLHLPKDVAGYLNTLKAKDATSQYQEASSLIERLNANNLTLSWGDNFIRANGNAQQLETEISITSLDELSDKLAGKVVGGATLIQPANQPLPTIYIDVIGERIAVPGLILREGHITGKLVNLAQSDSQLLIDAKGLTAAGYEFKDIHADFIGTQDAHSLTVEAANEQIEARAELNGSFNNKAMTWAGTLGQGQLKSRYATLNQMQPAQLNVRLPTQNAGGNSGYKVQLAAHCWEAAEQSGKLCLREDLIASENGGQVNVAVQKLDTSLFAIVLPNDIDWQGTINGRAIVDWQRGKKPNINATLYSDNGKIGLMQDGDSAPVSLPYQRVSLIALSVDEGLKLRTDINTGTGARGYAEVIVDPYQKDKPISGALVLNELNLAVFKPFFPGMRVLEGDVTLAGGLGGTLTQPQFYGDAKLTDGRIAMLDLPVNLSKVNATAKIRGTEAVIDGQFNSGPGNGTISGNINWQQKLQAKLSIEGERLVVTQPPLLVAEINPDVDIIIRPTDRYINIEGAISVPRATIRPPEASEDIITQTEDAVVIDRRLMGNIDEVLAVSKPWSINADIGIDLGDDINFRGFGAVIPLAGALNVTQQGQGIMRARGVVQVSRRSDINVFGQSLELNYGQVRFNGDVMKPDLSIEAIKSINGRTVGLRVTGDTESPNIVVFNDAGLTQQQAMNALVTGRINNTSATQISEQGFKSEVTNNLAAAGLSFGLSGTRSITNQIGQAFGLQSLTVDASGTSEDTNVNVTGYVTPDLYIRYGVGVFNAQNSLSIRYQLTRRIYIEAASAAENTVDVVYSWQF